MGERTRSYLKVQDGCNYNCSFCTIPLARGKSRSNSIEETIKVAKELSKKNIREIVLTGINIGDFGTNGHETFYDLIKKLDQLNYIDRLRISSIEPNLLSDEIIEFCAESKKFMPHFHIPLQSGSNKILSLMKRRYNKELYKSKINKVRNVLPNCSIGVDVMVGFPGESEEEFLKTYIFLNNLDISYLHVFTYSERNNTRALNYKDVVIKKERANRSKMLRILSLKKKRAFYNKFVSTTRPVLFESIKNNRVIGHTDNYLKVEVNGNKKIINTIKTVKLTKMKDQTLIGELALYRSILLEGKRAVWIVPSRALADEITQSLYRVRSPEIRPLKCLGNDEVSNSSLRDNNIWICTIEKFESLLRKKSIDGITYEIESVIVDEIHLLGDQGRGQILESIIARYKDRINTKRIVGLSATLENAEEFSGWLNARLLKSKWVPNTVHKEVITFEATENESPKYITKKKNEILTKIIRSIKNDKNKSGPIIIFCGSKNKCRNRAFHITSGKDNAESSYDFKCS